MSSRNRYRREREFGLLVGGILLLLGGWFLYRRKPPVPRDLLLATGAALVFLGGLWPAALRVPYRLWMALAEALSVVTTSILLSVVYFAIVTPLGLLRRSLGGDPLRRRARVAGSYWHPYSDRQRDPKHYEKMF